MGGLWEHPNELWGGEYLHQNITHFLIPVTSERWCRLRGNLLFFFKSKTKSQSQPAGVICLEHFTVEEDNYSTHNIDGTYGLLIKSGQQKVQHLRFYTVEERSSWKNALGLN